MASSLTQFLLNLIKPYKKLLVLMMMVAIIWALINTFTPYILKLLIDHVVAFEGSKSELFVTSKVYVMAYISLWVLICLDMRFLDWLKLKLFPSLREDVMRNMFAYLEQHSHQYFQNNLAGSLNNKIVDMQNGVIEIFTILDDLFAQTMGITIAIIVLSFVHPLFSVMLLAWVVLFLVITFFYLKPIQHLSHAFAVAKTSLVGKMVDSISNIANVRLFARHADENRHIYHAIDSAVNKDRKMQAEIIRMRIFWDISIILLVGLNLLLLTKMYEKDLVSIGDFTFVITLSVSILWNLWFLASQFVSFSTEIGICKQALSIISKPHDIIDKDNARSLIISKGKIQFHEVTFHYEGTHLFTNKNVVIEPGQKVGLVGFSGSGKSTFVNLILRLYEVESGKITIDNQNIDDVTQQSLREQIALIPQDITLFHRTLLENIRFGKPPATDNEIIEVSRQAHCHEFISKLPDGYHSMVGERGVKLSTGQRQRIAIARAMLKNSRILILDEATSALDSITENYIQDTLNKLMENKTTIVIAHRLSTLSKMDRILVFDDGQIIEDGTHEVLIKQHGHYARMWRMQAGGFLPETDNGI